MEFKIEAVTEKPQREYKKGSKYDPILDQFISGDHNMVIVGVKGKDANYMRTQLTKRIEKRGLSVNASVVNNQVYIEKI